MALPTSGQLSWSAIAAEYNKTAGTAGDNFYINQCAYLNSQLTFTETSQAAASDFHSANYGPDSISLTREQYSALGLTWVGYDANLDKGSVSSRSILEVSNRLILLTAASNNRSYFKATSYAGIDVLIVNGQDKWPDKIWDSGNSQYYWEERWWAATGSNVNIHYWYNT